MASNPISVDGDQPPAPQNPAPTDAASPLQGVIDGILGAEPESEPESQIETRDAGPQSPESDTQPANAPPVEEPPLVEEPALYYYPAIKLRVLDKVTAQTETIEMTVGENARFGSIFIRAHTCQKPPAIERKEAAAFLQVWELDDNEKSRWVFSGWMFASSPALSAMDHPVYDLWVLDCLGDALNAPVQESSPETPPSESTPTTAE